MLPLGSIAYNARRYTLLPLPAWLGPSRWQAGFQSVYWSRYAQCEQMYQHMQPHGPATDRTDRTDRRELMTEGNNGAHDRRE